MTLERPRDPVLRNFLRAAAIAFALGADSIPVFADDEMPEPTLNVSAARRGDHQPQQADGQTRTASLTVVPLWRGVPDPAAQLRLLDTHGHKLLQSAVHGRCSFSALPEGAARCWSRRRAAPPFGTSNSPAANSSPSSSNWIPDMHGAPSTPNRLVRAWQLAAPFWRSRESRPALALLLGVIGLTLGAVWLNVQFNSWNSAFYNSLQARDSAAFGHQLLIFSGLAAAFIVAAVYRLYLNQLLQMRWRKWMTDKLLGRWLEGGTQYRLRFADGGSPDNPDQRIAEDVRLFVSSTLELSLGLLNAVVTLVSFAGILWALSGDYVLPIGDGIRIPGFMLWAALLYSVAGSWLIHRLGRPLTRLNAEQQRREADFRFGLVRAREHGEAIALSRSEADEQARLRAPSVCCWTTGWRWCCASSA